MHTNPLHICPQIERLVNANIDVLEWSATQLFRNSALPAGWYPLVDELVKDLEILRRSDSNDPQLSVAQIKEKFGGLRFTFWIKWPGGQGLTDPLGTSTATLGRDAELVGALHGARSQPLTCRDLRDAMRHRVAQAHADSLRICEQCGAAGTLRKDLPWHRVLCDTHYSEAHADAAETLEFGSDTLPQPDLGDDPSPFEISVDPLEAAGDDGREEGAGR